jgi:hypothetical protein
MKDQANQSNESEIRGYLRGIIQSGQDASRMMISPDMAKVMMERNESDEWKNRHMSESNVARLARAIKQGRWAYTSQPIIFSETGRLLNGQHTLTAVIRAGVSIDSLVTFGVADEAFKFMDVGTRRQAGHIFEIEGISNYFYASAAAKILLRYYSDTGWNGSVGVTPDNDELLEFYYQHAGIQQSYPAARKATDGNILPPSWAGAVHYLCAEVEHSKADEFFYQLSTGIGIENEKSPIFTLRARLLKNNSMPKHYREPSAARAAYVIQAWNAWSKNQQRKVYRWKSDQEGGSKQPFPRVQ